MFPTPGQAQQINDLAFACGRNWHRKGTGRLNARTFRSAFVQLSDTRRRSGGWIIRRIPYADGTVPARVPDKIIAELRERERGGAVQLPEAPGLCTGDCVRVTRGPFQGHLGLYAGMKPRERIEVLLMLLGGQTRVELPRASIELAPGPERG